MDDKQRKKVIKMVRTSIISAAREVGMAKNRVEQKWQATKPYQHKAASNVRGAARTVSAFAQSVAQGVKEGVRDVRKTTTKSSKSR